MKRYSIIFEANKSAIVRHHKIDNYQSYTESKVYEPNPSTTIINKIVHEPLLILSMKLWMYLYILIDLKDLLILHTYQIQDYRL